MSDLKYFPKDYADAKKQFRRRVAAEGIQYGQWSVPSKVETDLFVDHAYFPALSPSAEKLFIVFSGVHGAESYAGHGIQMMILDEVIPKVDRRKAGFFVVHSLNPFGFKRHQRCTEAGVNINRNCSAGEALFKTENHGAVTLSKRFVPPAPVESLESRLLREMRREGEKVWFGDVTMDQFVKTAGSGQYASREGLEFGGFEPEPQIKALTWRLREIMAGYRDIVLLDLHTGLGDRARLHLLTGDPKACIHPGLFAELLDPNADRALYDFTTNEAEGFYPTYGATNDLVAELTDERQRVCALTMEFGTLGHSLEAQLQSMNQWVLEHQGMLYGYVSPDVQAQVKMVSLEKFYPSAADWRESIVFVARSLILKMLARSQALS